MISRIVGALPRGNSRFTGLAVTNDRILRAVKIGGPAAVACGICAVFTARTTLPAITQFMGHPQAITLFRPLSVVVGGAAALLSFRQLVHRDSDASVIERRAAASPVGRYNQVVFSAITGVAASWTMVLLVSALQRAAIGPLAAMTATTISSGLLVAAIALRNVGAGGWGLVARLSALLASGLLLSMLAVDDPRWRHDSLSYMGQRPSSAGIFNTTMILGGLGMLGLTAEMTQALRGLARGGQFPEYGAKILAAGLTAASAGLIGVGIFPTHINRVSMLLHNLSSDALLVSFLALMLGLRWIAPPLRADTQRASTALGLLCLADLTLYIGRLYNFVVFELVAISIMIAWLFALESGARALVRDRGWIVLPAAA